MVKGVVFSTSGKLVLTGMGIATLSAANVFIPALPVTIGGIIVDTVKPPICLSVASEETV